jgi:hypothetical protein
LGDALVGTTTEAAASTGVPEIVGGVPYATVFHTVLDCFHQTGCMGANGLSATDCFCGIGVDSNTCFSGTIAAATGPCKAEVMNGLNTQSMSVIANSFTDPSTPTGVAQQMVRTCDRTDCATECLGGNK